MGGIVKNNGKGGDKGAERAAFDESNVFMSTWIWILFLRCAMFGRNVYVLGEEDSLILQQVMFVI